jgi:hypothetical protein
MQSVSNLYRLLSTPVLDYRIRVTRQAFHLIASGGFSPVPHATDLSSPSFGGFVCVQIA